MNRRNFSLTSLMGLAGLTLLPQLQARTNTVDLSDFVPEVNNIQDLQMALSDVLSENIFELNEESGRKAISRDFNSLLAVAVKKNIVVDYSFQDLEDNTLNLYVKKPGNDYYFQWQFIAMAHEIARVRRFAM